VSFQLVGASFSETANRHYGIESPLQFLAQIVGTALRLIAQVDAIEGEAQPTQEEQGRQVAVHGRADGDWKGEGAVAPGKVINNPGKKHIEQPAADLMLPFQPTHRTRPWNFRICFAAERALPQSNADRLPAVNALTRFPGLAWRETHAGVHFLSIYSA